MDKEKKLSFSISASKSKPPRPSSRSTTAGDDAEPRSAPAPAPRFVTEFDASQTLAPAAAHHVIAPLQNSGNFLTHRPRKPSSLPTPEEEAALAAESGGRGPSFVLDTSTAPEDPSSSIGYGLTLRNSAADAKESENAAPPPPQAAAGHASGGDLMLQRYKEDMATLPDHRGLDEYLEVPVEGFGAALLAGYGWSEGKGIGRNNKTGDTKVVNYDRRAGTQGLGYNPSASDPKKTRKGDWIVGEKKATENGSAKKRDRDSRDKQQEKGSSSQKKRSGEQRSDREVREKERNDRDSREGKSSNGGNINKVRWLQSHIRVRVVSEKLSKRLYLMKGKVVDVVGPTTCDVMMDGRSELVQGVDQDMLETVLPRTNGWVLVLYGKHKGVYGHLIEKNSADETGVVQDADTKDMIRVRYDQIAEYVGDPELLGY
jgi:G patch domain and KOW motifs-containing protein